MIVCHLAEAIWGPVEIKPVVVDILNVVTGMDVTTEEAQQTAERIWNVIRAFAVREGLRRKDDNAAQAISRRTHTGWPFKGHGYDPGDAGKDER